MDLHAVMRQRGYRFRQHLEEEGWGMRKPTVVDLSAAQQKALDVGGTAGLKAKLEQDGTWSFPATDIEAPLARCTGTRLTRNGDVCAAVIAPTGSAEARMALELVERVRQRFGPALPVLSDDRDKDRPGQRNLIVIGAAHRNRLAMNLALRYQTFFMDASAPGDDGWAVSAHTGVDGAGGEIVQIAASPKTWPAALDCAMAALAADARGVVFRQIHRVTQGSRMRQHLPAWDAFAAGLPARIVQLQGRACVTPADPEALAQLLAAGLDSGGVEANHVNNAPIDMAILAARRYLLTAEPPSLALFRALLFALADYYLETPGGASYPADLDFRIGHVILYFARLEHAPIFTDADRLLLANLLLACARSINEYARKMWPVEREAPTRHNHETFPALSLLYAADYFERFGVADVSGWRAYADAVFGGRVWNRSKQKENASGYEAFTYEHFGAARLFTGRQIPGTALNRMHALVARQISATDNFLRMSDYGDSAPAMTPVALPLPRLLAALEPEGDAATRWYASAAFEHDPGYLQSHIRGLPGIRREPSGTPPAAGAWERQPLDKAFLAERWPGFPASLAFDKLAFRTGWGEDDQYVLVEGVGSRKVSHAHHETLGIVRLNHLGRHWLVSNGYGKLIGITNAAKAYSSRVRGPEDHNMLVLRRGGEIVPEIAATAALTQCGQRGSLLYATGVLADYGGVDWFRTLIIQAGRYCLVLDRVKVNEPGLDAAHIEWNCVGKPSTLPHGFRLEQRGVCLNVTSVSGWAAHREAAARSASWQAALRGKAYPYADFPLTKFVFRMPDSRAGSTSCLVTLLAAGRAEPAYAVDIHERGRLVVQGPHEESCAADGDLRAECTRDALELHFAEAPALPAALRRWTGANAGRAQ